MSVKGKKMYELLTNNKGFTLIEMAIVLIIIGIIIGAVVKGKDIIKSAEQKRLYTKFVQSWQLAYNTYYDRTGWILLDVNDDDNGVTIGTARDGKCSGTATCGDDSANLVSQLEKIGLEVPGQGPTGSECIRTYTDAKGRSYELHIMFNYRAATGNYIRICGPAGIPTELGMAWDRIIDGQRDGMEGDMLYTADYAPDPIICAAWPPADDPTVAASAAILKLSF